MFSASMRRASAFAMSATPTVAPFSRAVINAMRKLYPEALADKSWDNTGLLLEAPFNPLRRQANSVLLTVDLTKAVVDEAIARKDSIVVAYHPIIFRGLKSITLANSQQQSLLRLAAEGISVYCPHTAIDAAVGGLGDWLADIVTGTPPAPLSQLESGNTGQSTNQLDSKSTLSTSQKSHDIEPFSDSKRPVYTLQHLLSGTDLKVEFPSAAAPHTREPIKASDLPGVPGTGHGRIVHFSEPQPLLTIVERIAHGVGNPKAFPIAIPQNSTMDSISIRSVGICAGSGGSMFEGLDADLLFTGELGHHEALAAIERGQVVITLFHSNTERGFLYGVMKNQLLEAVKIEWDRVRSEEKGKEPVSDDVMEALNDTSVDVEVSKMDRDPYGILISKAEI